MRLSAVLLRHRAAAALVSAAALVAAGAGTASGAAPPSATTAAAAARGTLWLCRPGMVRNPCEGDLDATVVRAGGTAAAERFRPAARPAVDCFYVYPTVSKAPGLNAPLRADPEQVYVVRAQAARFASVCRVFAPVYRQVTLAALRAGRYADPVGWRTAHADVVAAWREYLARYNRGRPVVLLGHSQGTHQLTSLVQEEVDGRPAVRRLVLSALLIGGNVQVPPGRVVGGSFRNLPLCRRAGQTGCVVAYNSYAGTPPAAGLFGRSVPGLRVACTNPAALAGGTARIRPYLPADAVAGGTGGYRTWFVALPDAARATCRSNAAFTWLDVAATGAGASWLSGARAALDPAWGTHTGDVNLLLGDLVAVVSRQAASRQAASR